ncbi:hypothetical protein Taro_005551 [Colocasia esculenta]|uniref:Uncharacterized protein n=1 Tax=Colocasia esculenta TaxID=4460 RepID=A0A843TLA8_COLES|nr:hypothetical protein [Colocasia esculenta]
MSSLLAASGDVLVSVVVTTFPHDASKYDSLPELTQRRSVCHVASLVEHCDTCLWLLSALYWLVVSSGEVLSEFFSVGSGGREGLRYVVDLAGAFWRIFPELCLGGSGGGSPRIDLRCFCSSACCSVLFEVLCRLVVGLCILFLLLWPVRDW